jgi:hypothetical protein
MNKNQNPAGSAIKSLLLIMGISIFCISTTLVTFGTPFHTLGRMAACPGAVDYTMQDSSGGTVDPVGIQGPYSTKVFELECEFSDGSRKTVENDTLFLYGFLVSVGIGALLGLFIWLVITIRGRIQAKDKS